MLVNYYRVIPVATCWVMSRGETLENDMMENGQVFLFGREVEGCSPVREWVVWGFTGTVTGISRN